MLQNFKFHTPRVLAFSKRRISNFKYQISPILFIGLFAYLLIAQGAEAATGINRTINFQGKIVNKTGGTNITDGNYTFVFRIYNASSGGTKLWGDETQTNVAVTNGIFQVALGSVRSFATDSLDFNQDNLWLDVTFNGETFGSRIQLAAVPYALTAEKVAGLTVTNNGGNTLNIAANKTFIVSNSLTLAGADSKTLNIGSNSLTFTTSADTTLTLPSSGTLATTGGSENFTNKTYNGLSIAGSDPITLSPTSTGALTITSNGAKALTLDTGSAAGINIGTANANAITIGNTSAVNNTAVTVKTGGLGVITLGSNTGVGNVVVQPNAGGQAALVVNTQGLGDIFTASVSGQGKFVIDKNGRVGIQNASLTPQALLDIGTNGDGVNAIQADGGNFTIDQYGHVNALAFNYSLNSNWYSDYQNAQHSFDGYFKLNNTANPAATLDIRSAAGFNGNFPFGTLPVASVSGATSFAGLVVDQSGVGDIFTASTSGTTRFTVNNSGSVSIANSQSYTGVGAVTFSSGGSGGLTLDSASGTVALATGDVLQISRSGDPTPANGMIYYDATAGKFKIVENVSGTPTVKTLCNTTDAGCGSGGAVTLQGAYNGGQTIDFTGVSSTAGLTIGTANGTGNILLQPNAGGAAAVIINKQGSVGDIFTASASGTTKFVISHAGNVGIGSNSPQEGLTLGPTANLVGEMAAPTGVTAIVQAGGTLANATYFYVVTASDGLGETIKSTETAGCTSTNAGGGQHTCLVSWSSVVGAVSYKIYRTTTSGSYTGNAFLTSVTATSYSDTGSVTLTSGTPPAATTAYVTKFTYSGNSWLIGDNFGIGTTSPLATLHIKGGKSSGNAAAIFDQVGASTNDILTASASGVTKFTVHNDGSLQVLGATTADVTTITGGNGLTMLPRTNASGAGGLLTLKGGNGTGAPGGGVTIDAGTGSSNGTISIGATNASAITIASSSITTTVQGSLVVGVSGNTITLNPASGPSYAGNARPAKTIVLSPEYAGAVLTAYYGAGTDTNITGNMTSDTDTTQGTSIRNYYNWSASSGTEQFYTVAVRVTLPADFSAWPTSNAITVSYITQNATSTNSLVDVRLYNENSASIVASSTSNAAISWSTASFGSSSLTGWSTAGQTAVIYLRMGSASSNYARIGDIKLSYLAAF